MNQDQILLQRMKELDEEVERWEKEKLEALTERFGPVPDEKGFKNRMRLHQGWWRMCVLGEEPGEHPQRKEELLCSTIYEGIESKMNFLTDNTIRVVDQMLADRKKRKSGMVDESRLFDNLLSSQPLCFNFFSELDADKELGLRVLQTWWPELTCLERVLFEFGPAGHFDNSAFDVAFLVQMGDHSGIIGLECKYTDSFSYKPQKQAAFYGDLGNKNHDSYKRTFDSNTSRFVAPYYDFVKNKDFNQLFRNEMLAASLLKSESFDFVYTGLFHHHLEEQVGTTATNFKAMINPAASRFTAITYKDFIEIVQKQDLEWWQREWTMLLWTRYCATKLSEAICKQIDSRQVG